MQMTTQQYESVQRHSIPETLCCIDLHTQTMQRTRHSRRQAHLAVADMVIVHQAAASAKHKRWHKAHTQ